MHVRYPNRYGRTRSYHAQYEGIVPYLQRRHSEADSDSQREQDEGYMREVPCPACDGAPQPFSLGVTVDAHTIHDICSMSIGDAADVLALAWSCPSAIASSPSGSSRRSTPASASCWTSASTT